MLFQVVYDEGNESTHVFQTLVCAENAEQAIQHAKFSPDYRILGVLLLSSKHEDNICNGDYKVALEIEDQFRNQIRDNIVSYEPVPSRVR